ncbi:MAG: hypothetical protein NTV11_13020 [Rhodocyclales bacterium]|nr:hypothetical protein [Rhodocyclales bacterium]
MVSAFRNRRHTRIFLIALAMMWSAAVCATDSGFQRLSAANLRSTLIGKTVTDDAHWMDRFLLDGVLDSVELGESRRGAWVIEGGELCIKRKARRPVKECFEVWRKEDRIEYRRDGITVLAGVLRKHVR